MTWQLAWTFQSAIKPIKRGIQAIAIGWSICWQDMH
jgi:hypothetical protein